MLETDFLLGFNVKVLRWLNLWPESKSEFLNNRWRLIKDFTIILSLMPTAIPILLDLIRQAIGKYDNITDVIENFIALAPITGMIYMTICFIKFRETIKILVIKLQSFKRFGSVPGVLEVNRKWVGYTKWFLLYCMFGNISYAFFPFLGIEQCKEKRVKSMYSKHIPCGLITRVWLPFPFHKSPVYEIVLVHIAYTCVMVTVVILSITMLLCGILMHVVKQIQILKSRLLNVCTIKNVNMLNREINFCIYYHICITEYSKNIEKAFSSMMLIHITLTSFIVSVLGFEILMVDSFTDSLRFGMHLGGWLVLLLLTCYYGQKLIDESAVLAHDAYSTPWYSSTVSVQKRLQFIIMRAQKPLTLSAASLGTMSLETFLKVMSSAYSYFTLLWKFKSNN